MFKNLPSIIEKFPNLQLKIEIVIVDPKFFARLRLKDFGTDWLKRSKKIIPEINLFNQECTKKYFSRLSISFTHYSNIPHWHGWLLNEEFLFLGRTNWGRDSNEEPQLQVGQNKYRYFDISNDTGQERITLFKAWFRFYTEMNSRISGNK